MAAPAIPPIRPGPTGPGPDVARAGRRPPARAVEPRRPLARDHVDACFLAPAAGHPDRTLLLGENFFHRDDPRDARFGVLHIARNSSASFAA
ncbi:hypothetical protein [Amycolatopsis sp. NBC_01286]|uniref:hypothetical protein n=1 Tax=Amycolatopsis sp. NBC_01286 TaxID=2903560 RepID=UPI002E14AC0E|nr:hypothetical protein OG570_37600 [Amycolatopsis sp. NBC_01286]